MMLRINSAVGGTAMPKASSTARTLANAWTVVHAPQTRSVIAQASGPRPMRIFSSPRIIVPALKVGDDAVFYHRFNAQVAFNSSYRIDDYACHGPLWLLLFLCVNFCNHFMFAHIGDDRMCGDAC